MPLTKSVNAGIVVGHRFRFVTLLNPVTTTNDQFRLFAVRVR